jgi:hypothetical protein
VHHGFIPDVNPFTCIDMDATKLAYSMPEFEPRLKLLQLLPALTTAPRQCLSADAIMQREFKM